MYKRQLPDTPVRFGTNSIPVPDTSVSSVRPQYIPVPDTSVSSVRTHYRYPTIRKGCTGGINLTEVVQYGLNTLPNTPAWLGTNPMIPVPDTLVVRYDLNTGTRNFGKFGMTSKPIPDTLASSVHPPTTHRVPVAGKPYRTHSCNTAARWP